MDVRAVVQLEHSSECGQLLAYSADLTSIPEGRVRVACRLNCLVLLVVRPCIWRTLCAGGLLASDKVGLPIAPGSQLKNVARAR